jgi:hypothetical protein
MNAVGAATFPDNPRDRERVRENLYEYLNLPEFSADVPNHYYAFMTTAEEFEEDKAQIFMGIVKNIKRGKGWSMIEMMDRTGTIAAFDKESTTMEAGKSYLVLSGSKRIMTAVPVEEIAKSKTPLVKFLNYKTLPYGEGEYYVVSFSPRVTKAGKRMGHMVVADAQRELHSVIVFPGIFTTAYMKAEPGSICKFKFNLTKEGSLSLQEIL